MNLSTYCYVVIMLTSDRKAKSISSGGGYFHTEKTVVSNKRMTRENAKQQDRQQQINSMKPYLRSLNPHGDSVKVTYHMDG